jgi:hypothetical protein
VKARVADNRGLNAEVAIDQVDRLAEVPGLGRFLLHFHASLPDRGSCPHCGWTEAQYLETGYVGCPLCYSALEVVAGE